jgi:hypothetical protein
MPSSPRSSVFLWATASFTFFPTLALVLQTPFRVYHANPAHEDPSGGIWCVPTLLRADVADAEQCRVAREDVAVPGVDQVFILRGVLEPKRCATLVAAAESVGFVNPLDEGDDCNDTRDRAARRNGALSWVLDDATAAVLSARVAPWLPPRIVTHQGPWQRAEVSTNEAPVDLGEAPWVRRADGAPEGSYTLAGLNQRCRLYRYRAGSEDEFPPHIDEVGNR